MREKLVPRKRSERQRGYIHVDAHTQSNFHEVEKTDSCLHLYLEKLLRGGRDEPKESCVIALEGFRFISLKKSYVVTLGNL